MLTFGLSIFYVISFYAVFVSGLRFFVQKGIFNSVYRIRNASPNEVNFYAEDLMKVEINI
jgi:hypothetical protein